MLPQVPCNWKHENYSVSPLINGLSDYGVQLLSLFNITIPDDKEEFYFSRRISKLSLDEFQTSLRYEMCENVFNNNDDDTNTLSKYVVCPGRVMAKPHKRSP
jgi:hypothetical protein